MNPLSRVYVTADISGTRDSFIEIRNFFFGKKFLRRRKRKDSLKRNEIFFMKWIYDSLIESTWKMFERNSNNNKEKNNSTKSKLWIECWEFMLWVFCKYAWVLKDRKIWLIKEVFRIFTVENRLQNFSCPLTYIWTFSIIVSANGLTPFVLRF